MRQTARRAAGAATRSVMARPSQTTSGFRNRQHALELSATRRCSSARRRQGFHRSNRCVTLSTQPATSGHRLSLPVSVRGRCRILLVHPQHHRGSRTCLPRRRHTLLVSPLGRLGSRRNVRTDSAARPVRGRLHRSQRRAPLPRNLPSSNTFRSFSHCLWRWCVHSPWIQRRSAQ